MKKTTGVELCAILSLTFLAALFTACASTPENSRVQTPETAITATLVGKAWLLAGYDTGSFFVPLEPGHGTTARVVFSANGKLEGSTGFTVFSGTWKAGKADTNGYSPMTLTATLTGTSRAPNATAIKFEKDLLSCLTSARLLKMEKDSFRLLDGQKRILLRYLSTSAE